MSPCEVNVTEINENLIFMHRKDKLPELMRRKAPKGSQNIILD